MAHLPNTLLPLVRPSDDGKWLRCPQCSAAYWGAFRPTDFIVAKLTAHTERKHKAGDADAGAEAPAVAAPKAPAKAKAAPKKAAKIAAKAAAKGDGVVRIVRAPGPSTADLLGQDVANLMADVAVQLDPRLQLAQGPRQFSDAEGNNRFQGPRQARDRNKGQDVIARVQAQLSPIKGWN